MSSYDEPWSTPDAGGRHPLSVGPLVMGIALIGLVAVWALVKGDVVTGDAVRFLLPLPWVLAGAGGLAASMLTARRRSRPAPQAARDTDLDDLL